MIELDWTWAVAAGVVFSASFAQGVVGFGFGMISMALLPLVFDVSFAVVVVSGLGLLVNGSMLVSLRRDVSWHAVAPLLAGGIFGIPLGVGFLRAAPADLVLLALGTVVLGYVGWSIWGRPPREGLARGWGLVAGFTGGILGGAFNTGGPPAVMYVSGQPWSVGTTKATLQVFFVLTSVVQLSLFGASGMLSVASVGLDLVCAPAVFLGVWLGVRVGRRIDKDRFRVILLGALFVLGVVFVVRAVA